VISLDPEGYPTFHLVEVGMDNGTMVEITKGLEPGEVVVISGQPYIEEGTPVMVAEEE
jgi:multidrug efflux pump subunit AcrA (membrane-fusion protein)